MRACIQYGIDRPHLLHAPIDYQHFFRFFLFLVELGVKVWSILCELGPAERAISRNMDRSRMSGIGKLHDDGHVPCNKFNYAPKRIQFSREGIDARTQFAAIDNNLNVGRLAGTTAQGCPLFKSQFSRHKAQYVTKKVHIPKNYDYINNMMQ